MQELSERWYSLGLAPCREQVVCQMVVAILPRVVATKENIQSAPRALNCVDVIAGDRIFEVDAVVDGAMLVTQRAEIVVRTPAITNDPCACFDPVTFNGQ